MVLHVITNPLKKLLVQILKTSDHTNKPLSPRSLLLQSALFGLCLLCLLEWLLILTDVEGIDGSRSYSVSLCAHVQTSRRTANASNSKSTSGRLT